MSDHEDEEGNGSVSRKKVMLDIFGELSDEEDEDVQEETVKQKQKLVNIYLIVLT
jgi:CBS domain containing-hemolysin-like protein